jgi:GT2 family glycosyltransferase
MRTALLIPMYNSASTIGETLESVQRQTDLERILGGVYLADDCSRDESIRVAVAAWRSKVAMHVLRGERNLGERGNVNHAMDLLGAEYDWVLLLHADDLVKPNWLGTFAARMEICDTRVASLCSSWDNLWADGRISTGEDDPSGPVVTILGTREAVRDTLLRGCWWHISGCAIRLKAFQSIGAFRADMPQMGDYDWLVRCLRLGWAVEYVPRTLLLYRQHAQSVSSTSFRYDRDIREHLLICRENSSYASTIDLCWMHARMSWFLLRRAIRAMSRCSLLRLLRIGQSEFLVLRNWLCCLWQLRVDFADSKLAASGEPAPAHPGHTIRN